MRYRMGQERLNMLLIMSIESELLRAIDFTELINEFATVKARKNRYKRFLFIICMGVGGSGPLALQTFAIRASLLCLLLELGSEMVTGKQNMYFLRKF